jgi:inorganic pyrophosphatase
MDESAFPGCLVESRLVGVIEAEQVEDGEAIRNDRLVAVASKAHDYQHIHTLKDVNENLLKELEHFFKSYNEAEGKEFTLLGVKGPSRARNLVAKSAQKESAGSKKRKAK